MMAMLNRRSALTVIGGGGAYLVAGRGRAETKGGRAIYPVAVPLYQTHFVADRVGYFSDAGLDCKLLQGGSGVPCMRLSTPWSRRIAVLIAMFTNVVAIRP